MIVKEQEHKAENNKKQKTIESRNFYNKMPPASNLGKLRGKENNSCFHLTIFSMFNCNEIKFENI